MFCNNIKSLDDVFKIEYERARLLLLDSKYGIDVDVKKHLQKRSNQANSFYWVNNEDVAKFLNDSGVQLGFGLPFTSETIHEINKKYLGVPSTKKKDIHSFSEYMTKVFSFWIEKTNGMWQPKESPYGYLEKVGLVERG